MDLETIISRDTINIKSLVELYRQYLKKNSQWLFKDAPRRADMKIREEMTQAAGYAKQLGISEISLVFFIDSIDDKSREQYQAPYRDDTTGVKVMPLFIETAG